MEVSRLLEVAALPRIHRAAVAGGRMQRQGIERRHGDMEEDCEKEKAFLAHAHAFAEAMKRGPRRGLKEWARYERMQRQECRRKGGRHGKER